MAGTDDFSMPSLGADMTEGRITEWLVSPGDEVERGQIIVVVETDKSDIEVEVFDAGQVLEILVEEGELVPVGMPIARIGSGDASTPIAGRQEPAVKAPEPSPITPPLPAGPTTDEASHVNSPLIRHLADDLHVDTEHVDGTGPGGRVRRDDVVAASHHRRQRITPRARRLMHERGVAAATLGDHEIVTGDDIISLAASRAAGAEHEPHERPSRAETMRLRIASLMSTSWADIPHYHVAKRIDLSTALDRLQSANEERPLSERLVPGALLLCAAARAAAAVPTCNGWWRDDRFQRADDVNLGVVLSLRGGGIIAPTIEHADQLSPIELMNRLTELVLRARQGRLRASDLVEASITVTNLGDLGADSVSGVIHPPQVALVGLGAVHDEIWPVDGAPVARPTVHATLAGDHRATDGLAGSKLLGNMQTLLDGPLLEEL